MSVDIRAQDETALASVKVIYEAAETAQGLLAQMEEAAEEAGTTLVEIYQDAEDAKQGAHEASIAAQTADGKAQAAQTSADTAQASANSALTAANLAQTSANAAQSLAEDALADAVVANDNALAAQDSAETAQASADAAQLSADAAQADATYAHNAAIVANSAANGAVESLSIVEDVLGVLNWVSEHATYKLTEDTSVVPGKYYFERYGSGTDEDPYVYQIKNLAPDADPSDGGYYDIDDIEEAVSNFIATHMALTDEGLYLQTTAEGSTSRILVSPTEGIVIYGPTGNRVASYGANTVIGDTAGVNIKIDGTEVGFYDGATRVAYINNQSLYITQSVVLAEMMLGENKWAWKYDSRDDSIFLKWIG